jgi:filamentous hemagglutinin
VADVKGNLNIESLQDKATFDSKNQSISVNATVGAGASVSGGVNQGKVHNDYASVQEQSGLRAGDGGFQVKVGGNTDLKGAVISSSAAGADASSLTTGTLTHSDIANHATMDASSIGLSGGMTVAGNGAGKGSDGVKLLDVGKPGAGVSLPGIAATSSSETGVSRSGIGAGALVITDDAAQRNATGEGATQAAAGVNRNVVTGSDTSGRVGNHFDPNAVQASLAVTAAFTAAAAPLAANLVGDIGTAKVIKAQYDAQAYGMLAAEATDRGDTAAANAYAAQSRDAQSVADSWGDNGANRIALHAAAQGLIGALAGGKAGALSDVSGVVGGNLGHQLGQSLGEAEADKQGLTGLARENLVNTYQQTLAGVGGALAGLATSGATGQNGINVLASTAQGASTATAVDVFNRQLHPNEIARIKTLAGTDAAKEVRLTAAACAAVKCYAEYPVDSEAYQKLKQLADIGSSPALSNERQQLANQAGLFGYTTNGMVSDASIDAAKQLNNTYQIGTRALGAGQMVLGGLGVVGSVATAPVSCATGIGCVANAAVGTISLDAGYAGAKQLVSGNPQSTYVNQGFQALGMSPQAAGLMEAALGIGSAATAAVAANKAVDQAIAISKLSTASYKDFTPIGLEATPAVMQTSQARALVQEIQAGSPGLSEQMATEITKEIIQSGTFLPKVGIATSESILIKVVPKGDGVSQFSPYWMSPNQAREIATMTPEQAAQALGLPASQAARMLSGGMDFYAIVPKPGVQPKIFVSEVAPTLQGTLITAPSAQQVIVPNRNQWSTPVPVNPLTLK